MKSKSIVCFLISVFACIFMSFSVYAATSLSVGTTSSLSSGKVRVPIYFNSTDYTTIAGYSIQVFYDGSKFDSSGLTVSNQIKVYDEDEDGYVAVSSITKGNELTDSISGYNCVILAWDTDVGTAAKISTDSNGQLLVAYINFQPADGYSASDFSSSDFAVKIRSLTSGTDLSTIKDDFATYIIYNVPQTVPEDWEYGYIKAITAKITDAEGQTFSVPVENYEEVGTNYSFIINLSETTKGYTNQLKSIVDVEIIGTVTDSEDGKYTTDVTLATYDDVEVEYLAEVDRTYLS